MLGFGHTIPKLRQNYKEPSEPSFFDQFGTPAAAYSLRDLSGTNSAVIEVRRSSDNAAQDFTASEITDGSLATWVGVGNDGFVRTFYDQAGANDATQTTSASQPKIVDVGAVVLENGLPAIQFDGVDDDLQNLTFTALQPYSIFGTYKNLSSQSVLFRGVIPLVFAGRYANNNNSIYGGAYLGNASFNITTHQLITGIYNGASSFVKVNDLTGVSGDAGTRNISGISIGSAANFANYLSGTIQELIFFNSDQTGNRTSIETNINDHYSIY